MYDESFLIMWLALISIASLVVLTSSKAPGLRLMIDSRVSFRANSVLEVPLASISKRQGNIPKHDFGLRVFNQESGEWLATVQEADLDTQCASLLVTKCLRPPLSTEPKHQLSIVFSPCKTRDRLRGMVDGCTALGVHRFIAVTSAFSPSIAQSAKDVKMLRKWAEGSIIQSERLTRSPTFEGLDEGDREVVKVLRKLSANEGDPSNQRRSRIFLAVEPRHNNNVVSLLHVLQGKEGKEVHHDKYNDFLVIGPEGGFTETEVAELCESVPNLVAVALGGGVMRAELAALVGTGVWNCWLQAREQD